MVPFSTGTISQRQDHLLPLVPITENEVITVAHPFNQDFSLRDSEDRGIRLLEEERRRIARDLHDGPIQVLINLSMRLQIIQRLLTADPKLAEEELERIQERLIGSINEIRQLIYDLQPVAIDEIGLIAALTVLFDRLRQESSLSCHLAIDEALNAHPLGLTPARTIGTYRLIQESLSNIRKHAEAHTVTITLAPEATFLKCTIQDDGIGFDPATRLPGHFGLDTMVERAEYMGGTGEIESSPGKGTRLTFLLPMDNHGA